MPEENGSIVAPPQGSAPEGGAGNNQPASSSTPAPAPGENRGSQDDARQRGLLTDLQNERRQRQELQARADRAEQALQAEQRRVRALAGVDPSDPEAAEREQVRGAFAKLYPGLAKLSDEKIEKILAFAEQGESLQQTVSQHWENHGQQMLDMASEQLAEALGTDKLTERQARNLARAYVQEAESNPQFLARHNRGDKTLIGEFVKDWVADWYEPARRRVTSDAVNSQRRVPTGRDRSVQTTPPKPIDFKDPKAVEDAMVASFKAHGGVFGE